MQQMENQIYELQNEMSDKDKLIRNLNQTIIEQRDYLEKEYSMDNSQSMSSFDSKVNMSAARRRRKASTKEDYKYKHEEDTETIEGLQQDIKQLLKEYKLIEQQKDDFEQKYEEVLSKNDDLIKDVFNLEKVMEDQDNQISMMREKLQSKFITDKQNDYVNKYMDKHMKDINNASALDFTTTDLDKSANISRQINLENFKAGKIGTRRIRNSKKVDPKDLKDALNLSYQIIMQDDTKREQSIIEEKLTLSKVKGTKYLTPLIQRQKEGLNTDSTTAEKDPKGVHNKNVSNWNKNLFSEEKVSKSIIINNKERLQNMINTPREQIKGARLDLDWPKDGRNEEIKGNKLNFSDSKMTTPDGKSNLLFYHHNIWFI